MKPKIFAIYLPQYYRTEYNDKWWGDGYTEWTACRNAKPLFKGHNQPRIPFKEYDLSDYKNIKEQSEIAHKFGIDGFVIYQYYSCGNKLLEVPTELLLEHKDVDIEFCLYWANETWEKRWYGQSPEVIWKQEYGEERDWIQQFNYCLPFFKDDRYIKVGGKPVYIIYKDWNFKKVDDFIEVWNHLAYENGFDGIYFIKTVAGHNDEELNKFNACFEREPFYTLSKSLGFFGTCHRYVRTRTLEFLNKKLLSKVNKQVIQYSMDYAKCCDIIENRIPTNPEHTIFGAFTDWDNSPRRQYNSTLFRNTTPQLFGECLKIQYEKAKKFGSPFVIINAWNEWGEGNYLEPDQLYAYGFLEEVKKVKENSK